MAVDTKKVTGRRAPSYESLEDMLADVERLSTTQVEMLGNWSLGQVFRHLAIAINGSIDGFSFRVTLLEILFAKSFLKRRMLTWGFPAGYGFWGRGASVMPGETSVAEGLAELRAALARFRTDSKRSPHPLFGKLTSEEWYSFHLRHAELHMSFAIPKN
jgi:hypothetical protein